MITLLDSAAAAVWRASWQALALSLLIVVLLCCFGERLAPKWRYLLWSVVVLRLLFVATPASPWSAFNFIGWTAEPHARPVATREADAKRSLAARGTARAMRATNGPHETGSDSPDVAKIEHESSVMQNSAPANSPSGVPAASSESATAEGHVSYVGFAVRILPALWLAGCLAFGLRLLGSALVLRRRLAACRPVTDLAVLKQLERASAQIGLKRTPALLVTPDAVSPSIVGTWNPRIVLPESIATESSAPALSHVLAHELAHLVRGDLWTNWLLLAARILHWFNPVAWWSIREMQAEREAACDELALAALGPADRKVYATTIVDLAAKLVPSGIAPGMIGLFSSTGRLQARVDRLLRSPGVKTFQSPFAAGLLLLIASMGLTDSMPGATAQVTQNAATTVKKEPTANTHSLGGRCLNDADGSPLAGATVRLFKVEGQTSPPEEIAKTVTDADGRYTFTGLVPTRREDRHDRLNYAVFGFAAGRPIGMTLFHFRDREEVVEIHITREHSTLAGKVIDAAGRPVANATVVQHTVDGRPVPSFPAATTDVDGRFQLDKVGVHKLRDGTVWPTHFTVLHADHPEAAGKANALPAEVVVTLADACTVTGTVIDGATGKPAGGAVVLAERLDVHMETPASTNAAGQFRLVLPEGRYHFLAEAKDRVCAALTDRECLARERVELPPFELVAGGFISGRVLISATDEPITVSDRGEPIAIGLYGPSHPQGKVISPLRLAKVDETGRFTLRAAAGENFPYFVNIQGDRMAWDTARQPSVVVKEGETTAYNMLITPKIPTAVKLMAAKRLVEALPRQAPERTAQIILEFRKLDHTVDETETWCTLMRALVGVGRDAVPQLCDELDGTTENRTLRRLAFALRAIGDPRAVPALIRAIPRTLLPGSSDYGLIVEDPELTAFMQKHDLDPGAGNAYFDLGRPEREIYGALVKLTKRSSNDAKAFGFSRSEDPRRQVLQRRILQRDAQEWQTWWEAHWHELTNDAAYQKADLTIVDEALPAAPETLGPNARLGDDGMMGAVLSPAIEQGRYAWYFYDLDAGDQPGWPAQIPKDEAKLDQQKLADWAAKSGVDLMCITHRAANGKVTYVLRTFGLKAWEISPRDLRNLDRLIAQGKLPEGRTVGELLMHYDAESEKLVPDANGAFLFVTREGSMGLIETTDRVVRTQNLAGLPAGNPPGGVGFNLGVRFNLRTIIP